MAEADIGGPGVAPGSWLPTRLNDAVSTAVRAAGPTLVFGLRLWASVCLALYVAFWLELDNAYWAGTSAALMCQPHLGASLRKGWFRMIGTVVGAVWIVALSAWFPQDRVGFLLGLALWGARVRALPRCCATLLPTRRRWRASPRQSSQAIHSVRPAAPMATSSILRSCA
jgi:hypothetical protein